MLDFYLSYVQSLHENLQEVDCSVRASSYDEPWMTRTYYSIGSAITQPLGMSQCWTNELRECGSSRRAFVVSYAEP